MTQTLIRGGWVLTAAPDASATPSAIRDGAVLLDGTRVAAVGTFAELSAAHPEVAVRGGANDVVTPGFVNTHGHFSEGLITGIGSQYTLWEWLNALIAHVNPVMTRDKAYAGTMLQGIQMLRSGVTTANDMFCSDPIPGEPATPGVVQALEELGLRGVVSFGSGDVDRDFGATPILEEFDALREAAEASRYSSFRVGVSSIGRYTDATWQEHVDYAVAGGHGVHVHFHEVREEVTAARQRTGRTAIGYAEATGMFEVPVIAAHSVWMDRQDRETYAANGVGVAHNPVANGILASGIAPVAELRALGIPVGIGVDGPASNDSQDFLQAMKTAALLARIRDLQATAMTAREAFEMSTIGGARALRMEDEIGSLEPGKRADLVVFDGESPTLANVHDPFQAVVFVAGSREVKDVWVDGELSLADFDVTRVDVREAVARARPLARQLVEQAGLERLSALTGAPLDDTERP
ncbi:amidohydrolase [Curtobacterium sp. MCJR17_055]|uniref:amidohydrolase family protein n=1 Tax=unclassified Curtobacterium TaxID=257496 RepID=UPI000D9785C8|nr:MULTISPECIES: amidohydrolase family protein [unclassified Curtobacterium]PYY33558.1 amidohydrolase [Curtobacterium sp. MCBD17_029]PYY53394.1 amidohydrolase [Curtobacterium sp. MCJR17_055]PYY57320.1 amidohydrolase [Curtobacterium sp. MCPF17_015]